MTRGPFQFVAAILLTAAACAQKNQDKPPVSVPTQVPANARSQTFRDSKGGVTFTVPAGWSLSKKDGLVSTFHSDARTAARKAEMRGVASMEFNPLPLSVLSGATFYYSVTRHLAEAECIAQAPAPRDIQDIGGMEFRHAHDEHGGSCTEARDEVYTSYRKGACYRFDLEVNTFCSASSGAQDLTIHQMSDLLERMTGILSSVEWDWNPNGQHTVPVPAIVQPKPKDPELQQRPTPEKIGE